MRWKAMLCGLAAFTLAAVFQSADLPPLKESPPDAVATTPGPAIEAVNLAPYQPAGWDDEIVVSTVTGTHTDSSPIPADVPLYIDWAVANLSASPTTAPYYIQFLIDDVIWGTWAVDPPHAGGTYRYVADMGIGSLLPGTHTLTVVADSTGVISESNEADNTYTRTITLTGSVNLTPYQPGGWSDKIVVSTVTGTNTDSATITPADTLYVDWAVINDDWDPTAVRFYTELYVDDVLRTSWYTDPPLNPDWYAYVADYSIGTLSSGEHTLRISTDSTGVIEETNEDDNEYTRTITVSPPAAAEIRIVPTTLTFGVLPNGTGALPSEKYGIVAIPRDEEPKQAAAREELKKKADRNGSVRVIVRLDVPFIPEGRLDAPAREKQRRVIRERQNGIVLTSGAPESRVTRFDTIPFVTIEATAAQLAVLERLPAVLRIDEDVPVPPVLASSNVVIGSPVAWAAGFTGTGQTVAVLDTGVSSIHPYFATGGSKIVSEACYSTTNAVSTSVCPGGVASSTAPGSGTNCVTTTYGCNHGTHVAGIVAGNDGVGPNFGVARGANLIAMQVFSQFNSADQCGTLPVPCALTYTTDQILALERVLALRTSFNIAAVNMSLGGGRYFDQATCDAENSAIKAAIDNLRTNGIATIIATGNADYRDSMGAPACVSSAISVGATDDLDNVASFSNIAPFIGVLAPGVDITSSIPGGGTDDFDGTSMAAPHVAGAWALMKQSHPSADIAAILQALRDSGTAVSDLRTGGTVANMRRINIGAAVFGNKRVFTIYNDGGSTLNVTSIARETPASWITWTPAAPFAIAPGASTAVTVTVDFDTAPFGESSNRLLVSSNDADESPYPGGVNITINNTAKPTVTISATDNSATEAGLTTGTFTVARSGPTTAPLTVNYAVTGTATAGADYATLPGSVVLGAGAASAAITVTPIDDSDFEPPETVILTLSPSAAYTVGAPASATVTITSDELTTAPPTNVDAIALTTTTVGVSWVPAVNVTGYRVYRSEDGTTYAVAGTTAAPPFIDGGRTPNKAYLYKVRSYLPNESGDSNRDLATTILFTDPVPGGARVKAAHFLELLTAVNAVRTMAGQAPIAFTAPAPAAGGLVRRQHVLDLRSGLDAARAALALPPRVYTDPTITAGVTKIKALHLTDLRNGVE